MGCSNGIHRSIALANDGGFRVARFENGPHLSARRADKGVQRASQSWTKVVPGSRALSPSWTADTVCPDWVDTCHEGPNGDINGFLTIDLTAKKGGHQ